MMVATAGLSVQGLACSGCWVVLSSALLALAAVGLGSAQLSGEMFSFTGGHRGSREVRDTM